MLLESFAWKFCLKVLLLLVWRQFLGWDRAHHFLGLSPCQWALGITLRHLWSWDALRYGSASGDFSHCTDPPGSQVLLSVGLTILDAQIHIRRFKKKTSYSARKRPLGDVTSGSHPNVSRPGGTLDLWRKFHGGALGALEREDAGCHGLSQCMIVTNVLWCGNPNNVANPHNVEMTYYCIIVHSAWMW
jgi:hypothetical protein